MEPNDAGGDADQHNDDDYKPLMGGEHDGYQDRCTTWEEAEAMHDAAVLLVKRADHD